MAGQPRTRLKRVRAILEHIRLHPDADDLIPFDRELAALLRLAPELEPELPRARAPARKDRITRSSSHED
jgi:hypothetical protein